VGPRNDPSSLGEGLHLDLEILATPGDVSRVRHAFGQLGLPSGLLQDARLLVSELVSNSILLAELPEGADPLDWPGPVLARRRQDGCVRFTFVPPGSRTPRRHRCQPEREADAARVAPMLTSPRYADPGYCQLAGATSPLIRAGADDESELGAFHHLYLPRREAHLRTRLDEHLRFGLEAGVFHAT
jgi:hypothetical protein